MERREQSRKRIKCKNVPVVVPLLLYHARVRCLFMMTLTINDVA